MRHRLWHESMERAKERLSESVNWFPFPALIGIGLVLVLRGHLLTDFNQRLGASASVMEWDAKPLHTTGIWLSMYEEDGKLIVTTDDRRRFSWPLAVQDMSALEPLVKYLGERTRREAYKTAVSLQTDADRARAVLAVDQSLTYMHLRPVLYALAEARISHYGFETRNLR